MGETYTIHVADNGYVIQQSSDYNGVVRDVHIATLGELEEQLTVFRVKLKLVDAQTPAAPNKDSTRATQAPAPKTALPKEVVEALMNMKPEDLPVGVLGGAMGKLMVMGHEVTASDLRAAWKP